ncbi:MAG: MFS transporter [Hamadaea sp.]|nr:MFS transporter [Hamadaea sp.]
MRLINPNFRRMWAGSAVSILGDQIFDTTILLWVGTVLLKDSDLAPLAVGGVAVAVSVATILIGPFAGVYADRWDKRRTMLVADVIRAGLVGVLALFAFLPEHALGTTGHLVMIYGIILLCAAVAQFFRPASFTLARDVLTTEAERAKGMGLMQATAATMSIVGPPLAAPLLFTVGYQWALVANAASFLASYLFLRGVKPPVAEPAPARADERASVWRELLAGVRFLFTSRILSTVMIAIVIVTLGTGAINTLMVFFVTDNLSTDSTFYGFLGTAEGVGIIIGSLLTGVIVGKLGAVHTMWVFLIVTGVLETTFAFQHSFIPALVLLALACFAVGLVNAALGPIAMGAIPRELLGRVSSVINPVQQVAAIVGALVAGWLASSTLSRVRILDPVRMNGLSIIFALAGITIVLGGIYAGIVLRKPAPVTSAEPVTDTA